MARKKIEPIKTLGKNIDELVVQKSKPLFALWQSDLTLAEFKILDTYLGRIDSHNPENRLVKFTRGELEALLGLKQIRHDVLDERLDRLMNRINLIDPKTKKKISKIVLFEIANAEQDEYGLWQVELMCTESAMKYFFNIEELGYLKYKLRCIINMTSRYTYIMFLYLEANRFRKTWTIELQELKCILACDEEECYKEFKFFNRDILKKVHKEIHEKTECKFNYEPIKKGRSVIAIRFTLETLPKAILEEDIKEPNEEYEQENELWASALSKKDKPCEFTAEQLEEINQLLVTIPLSKLPKNTSVDDINLDRYHYLAQKFATLNRKDAENTIRNRYSYLLKMLKQDIES